MHPPSADRSTKFWDRVSGPGGTAIELSGTSLKIFQSLKPYLKPDYHVLDFACGQGGISIHVSKEVKFVTGVDTSPGMIAAARSKAASHGNIGFINCSLFDTFLNAGSFDTVTAFNVLQYIGDKTTYFKRIHQLLKPGGLFISSTPAIKGSRIFLRGAITLANSIGLIPKMYFYNAAELQELISQEGFKIVEAQNISDVPERFIVAKKVN